MKYYTYNISSQLIITQTIIILILHEHNEDDDLNDMKMCFLRIFLTKIFDLS